MKTDEHVKDQQGVLFADISDSTYLYDEYGDERARSIVLKCLDAVRDEVLIHGGVVVDRIGDELMCRFSSAKNTARAAVAMQEAVTILARKKDVPAGLAIRIGFHFGPVVLDGDSLFGDTVYVAKRVSALARGKQIVTTAETLNVLGPTWKKVSTFVERTILKGKKAEFEIYRVGWDDPSATVYKGSTRSVEVESEITLEYRDETLTLDKSRPVFTLGRGERADLFVEGKGVSRLHAKLEYRKGYFVLVDVSTNGTVIQSANRKKTIHRDEILLRSTGTLSLGGSENATVRFRCRTEAQQ